MTNRSQQPAPIDMASYVRRMEQNTHVSGHGLGNTYQHYPCPFCGAPEWAVVELMSTERELSKSRQCIECGRGARAIFTRPDGTPLEVHLELVQTSGADQDEWYEPKLRRVG